MARTCIICGGTTGSREHIFPAALGGRRTNKGIYCYVHNNKYSGLAGIISEQLTMFNALIGVVGDHASKVKPVTMKEVDSKREIELTNSQIRFKGSQTTSQETLGKDISINNTNEAEEKKAQDFDIHLVDREQKLRCHIGTLHKQIKLGGDEEGLRAIGYIAQTFLAHSFPDIARLSELEGVKDYTLKNIGTGFVWWDFEPPDNLPANKFLFGHRVIVGLNGDDGTVYARILLFSTLNFAILFGTVPFKASQSVITDIDPLAKSPPNDIVSIAQDVAKGVVSKPDNLSASLGEAIRSGKAQKLVNDLMRRIEDFERETTAKKIICRIAEAVILSEADRDKLFADIVSSETQRVFRLMTYVIDDYKRRASTHDEQILAGLLDKVVVLDHTSANGLTDETRKYLVLACEALKKQMIEDFKARVLDQDRMEMLIGGGVGAYVVGNAIFQTIIMRLPDR